MNVYPKIWYLYVFFIINERCCPIPCPFLSIFRDRKVDTLAFNQAPDDQGLSATNHGVWHSLIIKNKEYHQCIIVIVYPQINGVYHGLSTRYVEIIQQINRSNPFSSTSELHSYQLNGDSEKDAEALHKPVDIKHMAWRMVSLSPSKRAATNRRNRWENWR